MSDEQEFTGPRIGDLAQVTGEVVALTAVGGEPGARLDVGPRIAPVWVPLAPLTVTERDRRA